MSDARVLLPGAVIGVLGGGQLGRMLAMAARSCGYRIKVLDPDPLCSARFVSDECICADFEDEQAIKRLAQCVDLVTLEREAIPIESLQVVAQHVPLRPAWDVIQLIQDRGRQKQWLQDHGFPCAAFRVAGSVLELSQAIQALGSHCFVKTTRGGYDGRSQCIAERCEDAERIFSELGKDAVVVEQAIPLKQELSVLVARSISGQLVVFPVSSNQHQDRILTWSVLPAQNASGSMLRQARDLAVSIAESLCIEGLLAVELFVTTDNALLINELAPRPHNTFHSTERATSISQFEQHIRAVCGLPLGDVGVIRPTAIRNLLGDLWLHNRTPDLYQALQVPTVRVHLYGKQMPRPGRKMGHLSAVGDSPEEARDRVLHAYSLLQNDR